MKRSSIIVVLVLAVVVVIGGFVLATQHKASRPSTPASSPTGSTPAANSVSISGFAFAPGNISIKKGAMVTWINQDSVAHTVIETDGQTGPNSALLSKGQSYSFTFNTAGTYHYHCSVHPEMTATVTVTD